MGRKLATAMLSKQIGWAFKSVWRAKARSFAAIIVTAVTIFLVGATLTLGLAGTNFGKTAKERFTLPVYLKAGADQMVANNLAIKIKELPGVKSVDVLSPDNLLIGMSPELKMSKEEIIKSIGYNPLPWSLIVTPTDPRIIEGLASQIKQYTVVEDVEYQSEVINKFSNLFDMFIWIAIGLALLSILVSSIVISSTVALSIAARKEEIEVMSFVGASPSTILGPFVIEGIFYGLIGGGLAGLAMFYGWKYLQSVFLSNLPWFNLSISNQMLYILIFGTAGFGLLIGLLASYTSSRNNLGSLRA